MSPPTRRTHPDPCCLEVVSCGFSSHTGSLLDPSQRPSEPSQCKDLLSFFVAQNVAHASGGYRLSARCQRPWRLFSMAGFDVTTYGRFWVTREASSTRMARQSSSL